MPTVSDVYEYLKAIAPEEMAIKNDNVGFLIGTSETSVSKILISLDVTNDVVTEALDIGAQLIVAHHPILHSISSVTDTDVIGKKIVRLLSGGISAICMHTNLDAARDGVNDTLAVAAGIADNCRYAAPLTDNIRLPDGEVVSLGRVGYLEKEMTMHEYMGKLKTTFKTNGIRFYNAGHNVNKVAVSAGSGGIEWENVLKSGCDTFVTGEVKYHLFLEAKELGINLIEGDHFCTENLVTDVLARKLGVVFSDIEVIISTVHKQTIEFF